MFIAPETAPKITFLLGTKQINRLAQEFYKDQGPFGAEIILSACETTR
jgi:hypothetical protein